MRYLVLLPLLLMGCESFDFFQKSATKSKYSYCNIPQRYRIFRTSAEICQTLGGHRVDDSKAEDLEIYYQGLTGS